MSIESEDHRPKLVVVSCCVESALCGATTSGQRYNLQVDGFERVRG